MASFGEDDPESLALSLRTAQWTIENMQDKTGYFYYRQYPLITSRTPMLHWGQATMFKGLANLEHTLKVTQSEASKPEVSTSVAASGAR